MGTLCGKGDDAAALAAAWTYIAGVPLGNRSDSARVEPVVSRLGLVPAVVVLMLSVALAGCTDDRPRSDLPTADSTGSEINPAAPHVLVFLSGRIAFPHLLLTTRNGCPFIIESVKSSDLHSVEIVGYERQCKATKKVQRTTSTRLAQRVIEAFDRGVTDVLVTSRSPAYMAKATVTIGLA